MVHKAPVTQQVLVCGVVARVGRQGQACEQALWAAPLVVGLARVPRAYV